LVKEKQTDKGFKGFDSWAHRYGIFPMGFDLLHETSTILITKPLPNTDKSKII
jgi:hypothetical protein